MWPFSKKKAQSKNSGMVSPVNSNQAIYPTWDIKQQTDRYCNTDDIYSIIRLLSTTTAMVPFYAYLVKADQSLKKLMRQNKGYNNPLAYKALQLKALEDLPETDPVYKLLEEPHETLGKFEFFEAVYSYLYLLGECFLIKQRPELGPDAGKPVTLQFMHPQNVVLKVSMTVPRRVTGYDYIVEGQMVQSNIPIEDVIHIKYFNPDISSIATDLRGLSPLKVLKKRLTRIDSSMDVSVAQLQNGGVPGIVYDKGGDYEAVERSGERRVNFYNYLRAQNSGAPYFGAGEMGYIELGMHLADLSVAELANIDFKKLTNVWGVSDVLFNSSDTNSENNVEIQTARLYTNTVLPNVYRVRDSLIRGLLPDFQNGVMLTDEEGNTIQISGDGKKRYIDADISDIPELQERIAKRSQWLKDAWWLTPNERREVMNYERYDDDAFDAPILPSGMMDLESLKGIAPLDLVTPQGN